MGTVVGLAIVTLLVLILPFRFKLIEHNLEIFFPIAGAIAVTISGLWSTDLVIEALKAPVIIGSLPIGIFQVVLLIGLLIFYFNRQFEKAILFLVKRLNIRLFVFLFIFLFGVLSSVISVILAAVLLAEIVVFLPLSRADRIKLVVVTCFALSLGAVLTPLGEPLLDNPRAKTCRGAVLRRLHLVLCQFRFIRPAGSTGTGYLRLYLVG